VGEGGRSRLDTLVLLMRHIIRIRLLRCNIFATLVLMGSIEPA
jgi:hypothetical protein